VTHQCILFQSFQELGRASAPMADGRPVHGSDSTTPTQLDVVSREAGSRRGSGSGGARPWRLSAWNVCLSQGDDLSDKGCFSRNESTGSLRRTGAFSMALTVDVVHSKLRCGTSPQANSRGVETALGLVVYGMTIGVALAAPIGPINIEIIKRGLQGGYMRGWLVGLGALSADTFYAILIVSGLTPLADRPALRAPLFLAGAVMLVWIGVNSVRTALRGDGVDADHVPARRASYLTGLLMALFNPMGLVYWLSIGAALVADAVERVGSTGAPMLVGGVFAGILLWVTFLSWFAQVARRFVTGRGMLWVTGIGGIVLIGFGLRFAHRALSVAVG
jgi:L-lysine exporter family protein LysE/ArgO